MPIFIDPFQRQPIRPSDSMVTNGLGFRFWGSDGKLFRFEVRVRESIYRKRK